MRIDSTTTASTPRLQNEPPISSYEFETTPENVNFFRFARLILDVCLDVLRDLIKSKISGGERELTKRIALNRNKILRSCRLSDNQENILFPSNNGVVKYKSLDFTLIYIIFRNVLHEEIEPDSIKNKRWGKSPPTSDTSLLAAIERIRECRNTFFAHATSSEMSNFSFNTLWMDIERSIIDIIDNHLGPTVAHVNYKNVMEKLKTSSTDPKLREALIEKIKLEKICDLNIEKEGKFCLFFTHFWGYFCSYFKIVNLSESYSQMRYLNKIEKNSKAPKWLRVILFVIFILYINIILHCS